MYGIFLLILAIFLVAISARSIYGFVIGAPILFSPKKATEDALLECQAKPGEIFYDLGSGTGRTMLVAAKKFGLHVCGFELSPPIAFVAKCNLWLHGVRKSNIYSKNFYHADLSGADIIFCFLTPKAMLRLKSKFERELSTGTRIISYAFSIPGWKPEKVIRNGTPGKVFYYIIKNS